MVSLQTKIYMYLLKKEYMYYVAEWKCCNDLSIDPTFVIANEFHLYTDLELPEYFSNGDLMPINMEGGAKNMLKHARMFCVNDQL